jgi:hypothetical protein
MVKTVKGVDCGLLTMIKASWADDFRQNMAAIKEAFRRLDGLLSRILARARETYPRLYLFSDSFVFQLLSSTPEEICQILTSKVISN